MSAIIFYSLIMRCTTAMVSAILLMCEKPEINEFVFRFKGILEESLRPSSLNSLFVW